MQLRRLTGGGSGASAAAAHASPAVGAATGKPVDASVGEGQAVRLMHLQAQAAGAGPEGGRALRFRAARAPWWQTWSWLFLTLVAVTAFLLAVLGGRHGLGNRLGDALALFPSGFPSAGSRSGRSVAFVVAMYMAPIVALWVTASVVVALYARHWTELRARRRRGHAVVCGLGEKGLRSARALLAEGFKVTGIDLNGTGDAAIDVKARGATVLEGDATQSHVLKTARVDRAAVVVCACDADSANATIASQVEQLTARGRNGQRVQVYVHLANPDLSGILRAPTFGLESLRLHFFNIYELWARALTDEAEFDKLVSDARRRPHIVVVGSTGLARSLLIWAAQRWYRLCPDLGRRIRITLVAPDASSQCAALARQYPALPRTAELVSVDQAVGASSPIDPTVISGNDADEFKTTSYLCLFDDAENLSLALQAQQHVPSGSRVVVPASAWTAELAGLLLHGDETIRAVGYSEDPDSLDVLRDSRRESMAREVHAHYLGTGEASRDANVGWRFLREDLRESNRAQVDTLDAQLAALWYEIVPLLEWDKPAAEFDDTAVETLAQLEHVRWCEEKRRLGYVYKEGAQRDDDAVPPIHPDLVPWEKLGESARNKDRNAVRAWPSILDHAGYAIQRSRRREQLARTIYEQHLRDRIAAGESTVTNPLLAPWEQLSDEQRDLSRSSADHIGVKLAMIGCRLVPNAPKAEAITFTDADVERLAEIEHERWCQERIAQGWQRGPSRDGFAKTHPDLVPWSELPENRRQIDRDHVQAIPELVAAVGLRIARATKRSA